MWRSVQLVSLCFSSLFYSSKHRKISKYNTKHLKKHFFEKKISTNYLNNHIQILSFKQEFGNFFLFLLLSSYLGVH
jgi:hypothetical protein